MKTLKIPVKATKNAAATNGKIALARRVFDDQSHSALEMCAALGISRTTLYQSIKKTSAEASE